MFVGLVVGIGFFWRPWLQRRRFGDSGVRIFRSIGWRQHLRDSGLLGLVLLLRGGRP
jgi:hypothetical protein